MRIACPICGPRDEIEFTWGGEAHLERPVGAESSALGLTSSQSSCPPTGGDSDADWANYLFMRRNPDGAHAERWCHTYGCGQWFNVIRDTRTHRVTKVYAIDDVGPMGPSHK